MARPPTPTPGPFHEGAGKPYATPRLAELGSVQQLTTSGSAGGMENMGSMSNSAPMG
jgi:hypothetical protein